MKNDLKLNLALFIASVMLYIIVLFVVKGYVFGSETIRITQWSTSNYRPDSVWLDTVNSCIYINGGWNTSKQRYPESRFWIEKQ